MINAELFTDEVEKGFVMFADLWRDVIQDVRRPHEMHRNLYLTCGFLWFESLDTVGNIQDNVSAQLKISTH